jgi:2-haloacid dehalogenase
MFKLLSFDVYGTLIDTPPTNAKAFRTIIEEAGAANIDPLPFYQFWEERNVVHYREPYRSYKEICWLSLEESFQHFGIPGGTGDLIERYFAMFPEMQLYPDVLPTLEKLADTHRLALVSNIDDDLLRATRIPVGFDVVCTAERARGYKPDGTLFRNLIANAGVGLQEILHSGQSQFTDIRQGARPDHPALDPHPRRRGHRMRRLSAACITSLLALAATAPLPRSRRLHKSMTGKAQDSS